MAANSFKQMSRDGTIKRTDTGMFISLEHIHVREGFNKREDDERTRKADDDLFNYLMNGGTVPPLEVIARDEGGVWVVEGHRRRRCYARCAEAGKPVDRIHIMPFNGNDVQRLARIMTSNNQLPLSDIEQAAVIQELHNAFNQTTSEIAKLVNKSVATVEKLLTLSTANYEVQQEVKSGAVSVDVAVDRVREFGEQAGEVLQHDKAVAAAQGKTKVTRSSIAPELNIKSARRFVELMAMATISDEGVFTLQGTALAEALAIIDEHKTIAEARETYRLSQPIPTTEIIGKVLYVKLDGKEIGSAIIYRGKNVTLDLGDKKIIASQSNASPTSLNNTNFSRYTPMQTINNRMTETQIADLFSLAVQLQVKAEESDDRDTAILAYSIQNACSNLTESRREFWAADATINNLELKITDMAVQLANAESKCKELAAENAGLKELIEQHANSVAVCPNCSHEEPSETDDIVALYRSMETPTTDAFLAEVRAQGVEMAACTLDDVNQFNYANMLDELAQKLR